MKEWEVVIYETVIHRTVVEADNAIEAYGKAYNVISDGPIGSYETESEGYTGDWSATEL